jgi:hypothetical protein
MLNAEGKSWDSAEGKERSAKRQGRRQFHRGEIKIKRKLERMESLENG